MIGADGRQTISSATADGSQITVIQKGTDGLVSQTETITKDLDTGVTTDVSHTFGPGSDGTYAQLDTTTRTSNPDGSSSTTHQNAAGQTDWTENTTVDASGNQHTFHNDLDPETQAVTGETVTDRSSDGSTQTVTHYNADGNVDQQTVSTLNPSDFSTTTETRRYDANGNELEHSTSVMDANGHTTQSETVAHTYGTDADGNTVSLDTTTTTVAEDGSSSTTHQNAAGQTDWTERSYVDSGTGDRVDNVINRNPDDGSVEATTSTVTHADGSQSITAVNGDYSQTTVIEKAPNGQVSQTETINTDPQTGASVDTTRSYDTSPEGNNALLGTTTKTTTADGSESQTEHQNADGQTDWTDHTTVDADGNQTTTHRNIDPQTGETVDSTTSYRSADNTTQSVTHSDGQGNVDDVTNMSFDPTTLAFTTDEQHFDAAGNLTSDSTTVDQADGSFSTTITNGAGQLLEQDSGSTDPTTGVETVVSTLLAPDINGDPVWLSTTTTVTSPDGTPVSIAVQEGNGASSTTYYDAAGNLISASWTLAGGGYGATTMNPDGSGYSESHDWDGSYSTETIAAGGATATSLFNANGDLTGTQWTAPDGAYGSTAYNPDGSGSSQTHNADGSSSGETIAANGATTTYSYDVSGELSGIAWTNPDGTSGSSTAGTTYQADGSYTVTTFGMDDGGYSINAQTFSADDQLLSEASNQNNLDFSTVSYTYDDANGVAQIEYTDNHYAATGDSAPVSSDTYVTDGNGMSVSNAWSNGDGSYGTESWNADGSSQTNLHNADGTSEDQTLQANGSVDRIDYAADGAFVSESWGYSNSSGDFSTTVYADGSEMTYAGTSYSTTIDHFDPSGFLTNEEVSNGLTRAVTDYQQDGSYTSELTNVGYYSNWATTMTTFDAATGHLTETSIDNLGNVTSTLDQQTDAFGAVTADARTFDDSGVLQHELQTESTAAGKVISEIDQTYDDSGVLTRTITSTQLNDQTWQTDISYADGSYFHQMLYADGASTEFSYDSSSGEYFGNVNYSDGYSESYSGTDPSTLSGYNGAFDGGSDPGTYTPPDASNDPTYAGSSGSGSGSSDPSAAYG